MKWFFNLKVSAKLIAGFVLVALIAGAVGVVGIVNISKINGNYTELYDNFGVAIGDIADVSILYQQTRINLRDLLLDEGSTDRAKYVSNIKEYDKLINESLAKVDLKIQTTDGRKEFELLKNTIDEFAPIQEKIINLALANQEEQGLKLLRGDGAPLAAQINTSIDKLFDMKVSGGLDRSAQYDADSRSTIITMAAIVLAAMAIAMVLGILISRLISNPVKKLVSAAGSIADGDLNVTVEAEAKDEIGLLANAFKRMADNLNEVMANISIAAEQVASGASQVSDSSMSLSQGATEQASSIEELTASIEEISAQTRLNADSANQANSLAETAKGNAIRGNGQMKEMLKAMEEINDSSGNISKIIKVIDEIAFQTNILALNAAVEAARAGQHGKGFAVVAEEVRNLAARSANAAKETTEMIESSIKKVEGGTRIANQTAEALNLIVGDISKVANLVADITTASNEQAIGIEQINQGVMQVSTVVQSNSATSQESAAASEELSSQASLLKEQVKRFKLKKTQYGTYANDGEINSELLKILDQINKKRTSAVKEPYHGDAPAYPSNRIALSDNEFGKY